MQGQATSRCRCAPALHLPSLRFGKIRPRFPKAYINMLLELISISHALRSNLFSCCFEQYHILFRSGDKEAVTLTEAHKELTVFKAFGCFIKAFDFDSLAVAVDDSFWVHKDGNHLVGFEVGKLRHQS